MKKFTSIEQIKTVAERFKAGKIVPKRILKGGKKERKIAHMVTWSRDVYRLAGKGNNNVFLVDFSDGGPDHVINITGIHRNLNFKGNPYGNGNFFCGNLGGSNEILLNEINALVFGRTAAEV